MMRYNVENYSQYQKDSESKAVLNVDKQALSAYKTQRRNFKKTINVNNEIENLKNEMNEIKSLLYQLINTK